MFSIPCHPLLSWLLPSFLPFSLLHPLDYQMSSSPNLTPALLSNLLHSYFLLISPRLTPSHSSYISSPLLFTLKSSLFSPPPFSPVLICSVLSNFFFTSLLISPHPSPLFSSLLWLWILPASWEQRCPFFTSSPSCAFSTKSSFFLLQGYSWSYHSCTSTPNEGGRNAGFGGGTRGRAGVRDKGGGCLGLRAAPQRRKIIPHLQSESKKIRKERKRVDEK